MVDETEQKPEKNPPQLHAEQRAELNAIIQEQATAQAQGPAPVPEPSSEPPPEAMSLALCGQVVTIGQVLLCPAWEIPEDIKTDLIANAARVLDKYIPNGLGAFGPEIGLAVGIIAIVGANYGTPRYPEPAQAPAEPAQAPAESEPGQAWGADLKVDRHESH